MAFDDKGCFRLGKIAGITLYLHWSWFLVAILEIQLRGKVYHSLAWNIAEYLALFGIVLLHEFGHAFACRQTGGKADRIVLWPLGGVAFVNPPPRPGALLWSIAAGPLVNVVLAIVAIGLCLPMPHDLTAGLLFSLRHFLLVVAAINVGLFVFNILPIYPLDGGQIVYALLWFIMGRARALSVASVIGVLGALGVFGLAVAQGSVWGIIIAMFLGFQALRGLAMSRAMVWLEPVIEHLRGATDSMKQGNPTEAVAACDRALALIPKNHKLHAVVETQRAAAQAAMNRTATGICPQCNAVLTPPEETPGNLACGNCGWRSGG